MSEIERNHNNEIDRREKFLKLWKEKRGQEATYQKLIEALHKIEAKCKQDAESIRGLSLRALPTTLIHQSDITTSSGSKS